MNSAAVNGAVEAIARGAVVGVPTDTVYGLAADPQCEAAVEAIFQIKGRPASLSLVVLASDVDEVASLVALDDRARALVEPHWPGALTAVLPTLHEMAPGVGDRSRGTLAVRVPDHGELRWLLSMTGPLAVTSANRSGEPPVVDAHAARALFGPQVAVYLEGTSPGGVASTVVDVTSDPPVTLRKGPVVLG